MSEPSTVIASKRPTATSLSSRRLAALDRETKERALFSARTTEQRYLASLQKVLEDFTAGDIGEGEARRRLLASLDDFGYTPERGFAEVDDDVPAATPNAITDLSSYGRLNLVVDTNAGMAASVSRLAEETDETLDLFPAWRLTRFMWPNGKPRDWELRWACAGNDTGWRGACREEMVARKDSPIWLALGRGAGGFRDTLGNPYPPFAFNSGMGWEDVDRDEAEALGLELDEPVRVEPPSLAVDGEEMERSRDLFGDPFADALEAALSASLANERTAEDTECHVIGHPCRIHDKVNSETTFVARASYVNDTDYGGYRRFAFEHRNIARQAEDQLSHIRDRRTKQQKYRDLNDLFEQAKHVPFERLNAIARGYNDTCAVHEAVAFITSTPQIKDSAGRDISVNRWLIDHYLFGDRRFDNTPKIESLRELPRAIFAIKTQTPFRKVSKSGAEQYQYSLAKPKTNVYAYCNSGVVSGWHVIYFGR